MRNINNPPRVESVTQGTAARLLIMKAKCRPYCKGCVGACSKISRMASGFLLSLERILIDATGFKAV